MRKYLSAQTVLSFDQASCTVKQRARSALAMSGAIEDIRLAVPDDEFVSLVLETNDKLDEFIHDVVSG